VIEKPDGAARDDFAGVQRLGRRPRQEADGESDRRTLSRVVLADRHSLFRQGLRRILEETRRITIVGETNDGREAVCLVLKHRPRFLVMGLMMQELDGLAVLRRLNAEGCDTRTIVVSMLKEASIIRECFRSGADAFVPKTASLKDVYAALRTVASGQPYLSSSMKNCGVDDLAGPNPAARALKVGLLTSREREVLEFVAGGRTNASIAKTLGISPRTVDTHRTNLMRKLDIHNAVGLTRFAIENGLVVLPKQLDSII